jgi:hypothetical protein
MRADMHKVIVERERLGGPVSYRRPPRERNRPFEDMPLKEGMRRPHVLRKSRKSLNENLTPLKKYLRGQVGRPWNVVYREISERLRPTSAVQQHVRHHLWDFVERNPVMGRNGEVHHGSERSGWPMRLFRGDLYVHPRTGLLCAARRWRPYLAPR